MTVAVAGLLLAGGGSALAADAEPCAAPFQHASFGKVQRCPLFMPKQGSIPVHAIGANGQPAKVGRLVQAGSANWFVCQTRTPEGRASAAYRDPDHPQYRNVWWARTLSDDNTWGWVNEIYFRGGGNDEPDRGLAMCPGGGGLPAPAPTPPQAGPQLYTLGTFNMAGGNEKHGDRGTTADALRQSITDRGADIVFLQEACEGMTNRLGRDLAGRGYTAVFVPTTSRCIRDGKRTGSKFGIGMVYRSSRFKPTGRPQTHDLPSGGLEPRKVVCLDFSAPRPILACSTHFTAKGGRDRDRNRREQSEAVVRIVTPAASAGRAVFLGGDLNTTPNADALDPLWEPRYGGGASGPFIEVDSGPSQEIGGFKRSAGQDTTQGGIFVNDRKIDYIFVRGVTVTQGEVGRSKFSDHAPLWAKLVQ